MLWGKTLAEDIQLDSQLFTEEILLVGASQSGQEVGKSGCQDKNSTACTSLSAIWHPCFSRSSRVLLTDGVEIQLVNKLRCLQVGIKAKELADARLGKILPRRGRLPENQIKHPEDGLKDVGAMGSHLGKEALRNGGDQGFEQILGTGRACRKSIGRSCRGIPLPPE